MKVIAAPDKFKGSCSAGKAAEAIARGWLRVFPLDALVQIPVADGGDGTLEALHRAAGGELIEQTVPGPLGSPVAARWLMLPDGSAAVEMAQASGLVLVPESTRDVRRTDTFGAGLLVRSALDRGCRKIVVGIGGSATNDGGMGFLRALGARFYSPGGELEFPGSLSELQQVDFSGFDTRIRECGITVASDVKNPLCGPCGASAIYGPQKGASAEDVRHMDACLERLAEVVSAQMGFDRSRDPGAGAAGGLGWALSQCCGAQMRSGIDVVLDASGFDQALEGASLVITGEGSVDGQSAQGKAVLGVAARAGARGVPVAVIAGRLGEGHEALYNVGIACMAGIAPGPIPLAQAMEHAEELIEQAAERMARIVKLGMGMEREAWARSR